MHSAMFVVTATSSVLPHDLLNALPAARAFRRQGVDVLAPATLIAAIALFFWIVEKARLHPPTETTHTSNLFPGFVFVPRR